MSSFDFTLDDLKSDTPAPFLREQTKQLSSAGPPSPGPSALTTSRSDIAKKTGDFEAITEPSNLAMGQIFMNIPLYRDSQESVAHNEFAMSNMLGAALAGSGHVDNKGTGDTGKGLGGFDLLVPGDIIAQANAVSAIQQKDGTAPGQQPDSSGGPPPPAGGLSLSGQKLGALPDKDQNGAPISEAVPGLQQALQLVFGADPNTKITALKSDHGRLTSNGSVSNHFYGRAADVVGNYEAIYNVLLPLAQKNILEELFHAGLGWWKNGSPISGSLIGDHTDHLHLAIAVPYTNGIPGLAPTNPGSTPGGGPVRHI